MVFFFFFFQAEDGIRDGTVTGVQTCALPIYKGDLCLHENCRSSTQSLQRRPSGRKPRVQWTGRQCLSTRMPYSCRAAYEQCSSILGSLRNLIGSYRYKVITDLTSMYAEFCRILHSEAPNSKYQIPKKHQFLNSKFESGSKSMRAKLPFALQVAQHKPGSSDFRIWYFEFWISL